MLQAILDILIQLSTVVLYSLIQLSVYSWKGLWSMITSRNLEDRMANELAHAGSYEEWLGMATKLDELTGSGRWRANYRSNVYDYNLILSRSNHLKVVRESNDISAMMYLLRSGLLRNLGGITDPRLFRNSYLGTKHLIESYMDEVVSQLEHVAETSPTRLSRQAKIDFFMETRQSFGSSALLLHGGASFGMYHLGVVKTLFEHGLLPRIISGASTGAIVAALVCVKTDEELPSLFDEGGVDLRAFQKVGVRGNMSRKITRLMTQGYLIDINILQKCIEENVGDLTFDEAFKRTKRVLNITVPSSRKSEGPQLLNYITSPNVLISSAACASVAMPGLSSTADLMAKDKWGNITKWSKSSVKYSNPNTTPSVFSYGVVSETPLTRLSELFNVNHFIVSQSNPVLVPFMSRGLRDRRAGSVEPTFFARLLKVAFVEVQHRMSQLYNAGLVAHFFAQFFLEEKVSGDVTIVPEVQLQDFKTLISNPTHASIQYWVLKGEQSTWPFLALLRFRLLIELALDRILLRLRAEASASAALQQQGQQQQQHHHHHHQHHHHQGHSHQGGGNGGHGAAPGSLGNGVTKHHRRQRSGPRASTTTMTSLHHAHTPNVTRRGSSGFLGGVHASGFRPAGMTAIDGSGSKRRVNHGSGGGSSGHGSNHHQGRVDHQGHVDGGAGTAAGVDDNGCKDNDGHGTHTTTILAAGTSASAGASDGNGSGAARNGLASSGYSAVGGGEEGSEGKLEKTTNPIVEGHSTAPHGQLLDVPSMPSLPYDPKRSKSLH
ncbi:hypothetical protein DFQ26_007916 [Actinomortierella ambigua]|nr:hypothetical protein DFQ26_007916 [Actinomortierella ambigua]